MPGMASLWAEPMGTKLGCGGYQFYRWRARGIASTACTPVNRACSIRAPIPHACTWCALPVARRGIGWLCETIPVQAGGGGLCAEGTPCRNSACAALHVHQYVSRSSNLALRSCLLESAWRCSCCLEKSSQSSCQALIQQSTLAGASLAVCGTASCTGWIGVSANPGPDSVTCFCSW